MNVTGYIGGYPDGSFFLIRKQFFSEILYIPPSEKCNQNSVANEYKSFMVILSEAKNLLHHVVQAVKILQSLNILRMT
jgi:hypothetical protein